MKKVTQKQAEECLKALLEVEEGLRDSELTWVERFDAIDDRPFSDHEKGIIVNIYDKCCLRGVL